MSKFEDRLGVVQLLAVLEDRLDVELHVELEAWDDRRHIIEFIKVIFEILVDEWISSLLLFELTDQFRD